MLKLDGLSVALGEFSLRDLSFEVLPNEYFVLLGPTGAGKTVILEMIAGLLKPQSGTVHWNGSDLTSLPPEARPVSVVFQDLGLFPHLSVTGNIGFGPKMRGVSRADRDSRVVELARLMEIEPLLDRSVTGLSGGEKQRVALARALAVDPAVLLLDEPFSALDSTTRDRLREVLRRLHHERDTTVVHVTHDREVAASLADRIAVLLDGHLHAPRSPRELFRKPRQASVARFLGLGNVFDVHHVHDGRCEIAGHVLVSPAITHSSQAIWLPPEELKLHKVRPKPEPPNIFEAEVVTVRLLGSQTEVVLCSGELELVIHLPPSRAESLNVGPKSAVFVEIDPKHIWVM